MEKSISDHFVNRALDSSSAVPEGGQADTFYDEGTRPKAPTGDQLLIINAFQDGRISREEAEEALAALDQQA